MAGKTKVAPKESKKKKKTANRNTPVGHLPTTLLGRRRHKIRGQAEPQPKQNYGTGFDGLLSLLKFKDRCGIYFPEGPNTDSLTAEEYMKIVDDLYRIHKAHYPNCIETSCFEEEDEPAKVIDLLLLKIVQYINENKKKLLYESWNTDDISPEFIHLMQDEKGNYGIGFPAWTEEPYPVAIPLRKLDRWKKKRPELYEYMRWVVSWFMQILGCNNVLTSDYDWITEHFDEMLLDKEEDQDTKTSLRNEMNDVNVFIERHKEFLINELKESLFLEMFYKLSREEKFKVKEFHIRIKKSLDMKVRSEQLYSGILEHACFSDGTLEPRSCLWFHMDMDNNYEAEITHRIEEDASNIGICGFGEDMYLTKESPFIQKVKNGHFTIIMNALNCFEEFMKGDWL